MAVMECEACGEVREARSMTPCRGCGRMLCPDCAEVEAGLCADCACERKKIEK